MPRPSKARLVAAYDRLRTQAQVAARYGVTDRTIKRWFAELGIEARRGAEAVDPKNRRGGSPRKNGDAPAHVSPKLALQMRMLHRRRPDLSVTEILDLTGAACTRQMADLVLKGKRVLAPESFPRK